MAISSQEPGSQGERRHNYSIIISPTIGFWLKVNWNIYIERYARNWSGSRN